MIRMSEAQRRRALRGFANAGLIMREWYPDEAAGKLVHRSTQDVEPILKNNKQLYNLNDGYSASRGWRRAASIPNIVIERWMKQGINAYDEADWPKILAMLDSPEYLFLRTAPGRLSRRPVRHFFKASTSSGRIGGTTKPLKLVTA